jgi:hypothetical protein
MLLSQPFPISVAVQVPMGVKFVVMIDSPSFPSFQMKKKKKRIQKYKMEQKTKRYKIPQYQINSACFSLAFVVLFLILLEEWSELESSLRLYAKYSSSPSFIEGTSICSPLTQSSCKSGGLLPFKTA